MKLLLFLLLTTAAFSEEVVSQAWVVGAIKTPLNPLTITAPAQIIAKGDYIVINDNPLNKQYPSEAYELTSVITLPTAIAGVRLAQMFTVPMGVTIEDVSANKIIIHCPAELAPCVIMRR